MLQPTITDFRLADVHAVIDHEALLGDNVMDVQHYDDTLVLFTKREMPSTFARMLLKKVWAGPIEDYCASALTVGSEVTLS